MIDIAKGMHYLHSTPLSSHGNLKSSNCLVDGRWSLKVSSQFREKVMQTRYEISSFYIQLDAHAKTNQLRSVDYFV